jgi:benzoate-CoA ligase
MNAADAVLGPSLARGLADAPALVQGSRVLTYGAVLAAANQCGHGLRGLGIGPEQRVLLLMKDSPEWVSAYLGAIKVGAVAVPVNPRSSAEDLLFYLQDSRAQAAVLDLEFLPLYRSIADRLEHPPAVIVHGAAAPRGMGAAATRGMHTLEAFYAEQPRELAAVPMPPGAMAFWIYTSGTTGAAKAAVHAHRDVLEADAYLRDTLGVVTGTRLFATSKLFFAYALGTCLFGSFRLGATTVLDSAWPTSESVRETLAAQRPEIVFSVPALYRNVLRAGLAFQPPFRAVRTYVSAGEALPESVFRRWQEATGREIVEGMGTSETIYMFLTNRPGESEPGSAGYPAPGAEVRLVSEEGCPIDTPDREGLLQVRLASTCSGYWNGQAQSGQAPSGQVQSGQAISGAARDGDWFATGDLCACDAGGRWWHRGRRDDLIEIGGQRVNPARIEECVLALPEVADAVVTGVAGGVAGGAAGGGALRLVLHAVPAQAESAGAGLEKTIRRALAGCLPAPQCPPEIRFVRELPRTASGKVQRYRLRQELAREFAAPEPHRPSDRARWGSSKRG